MLLGSRVVVVVPAFEEAPRVVRVVAAMPDFVDHVVVVDDASRDGTSRAARAAGDDRVEVVRHAENRGVGAAIGTGYARALERTRSPRDAIAVMAGDAQMHPGDLARLCTPVVRGRAGYVKGDRFVWPGARRTMPLGRWAVGHALSTLTARAIDAPVHDSQCGYTAIAREACAALDLAGLWPRYGYPNDLLGALARRGVILAEVPVRPIYADEQSRLRARHAATVLWLIGRAWVRRGTRL